MFVFLLIEIGNNKYFLPLMNQITNLTVNLGKVADEVFVFMQDN